MAEIVDFQTRLAARIAVQQDAVDDSTARLNRALALLPIVVRAVAEMREHGCDTQQIAALLRDAADEMQRG